MEDDGVGFDFTGTEARVGSRDGGFGLFSIRERLKYLGGCLECASGAGPRNQDVAGSAVEKELKS